MGRPQQVYDKERLSLNLARLKKGGERFEIVLREPKLALEFKEGKEVSPRDFLKSEEVFKDAKKGKLASEKEMKDIFGTDKPLEVAKIIVKEGRVHLTPEIRKEMHKKKKKKIIEYIHMNTMDPKTKNPHPPKRIKLAMKEANVKVDPFDKVSYQVKKILPELRPIIPLAVESADLKVKIPAEYAAKTYSVLKGKYKLKQEKWNNDGSVNFQIHTKPGLKPEIVNLVNKLTDGEAEVND